VVRSPPVAARAHIVPLTLRWTTTGRCGAPLEGSPWHRVGHLRSQRLALALSTACSGNISGPGGGGGGPGGGGGGPDDEQFPPLLLQPYGGPPIDVYDNTFLGYAQLKGKVATVFGDAWVRGGVDQFQANIGLLGGADFTSHFVEARVATPDFLLALDSLSKDVCSAAVAASSGPFAGINVAAPVVDSPPSTSTTIRGENASTLDTDPSTLLKASTGVKNGSAGWNLYANGTLLTRSAISFPVSDAYTITVRARSTPVTGVYAHMQILVGGNVVKEVDTTATNADYGWTGTLNAGLRTGWGGLHQRRELGRRGPEPHRRSDHPLTAPTARAPEPPARPRPARPSTSSTGSCSSVGPPPPRAAPPTAS
jgi:hypothetical protein